MPTPEEIAAEQQAASSQSSSSHSVFDAPGSQQEAPTPAAEEKPAGQEKPEESLFSDTLFENKEDQSKSDYPAGLDAETIKKLEASGYKVEKAEIVDENKQVQEKLLFHQKNIDEATAFIAKDDTFIVKEKLKNDKADLYRNTGRAHMIGTEEFNIETEAEFESQYDNPAVLTMYAGNIREAIKKNVIEANDGERKKIVNETEQKQKADIQERTKKLDGTFDQIYKEGYLGMKFEKQAVIDARNNIVSGKFAEEVKNNPEILAKAALVYYQESKFKEKVDQPTYGEGVAATFHALNGKDSNSAKTSPISAANNMGANSQGTFEVNKWLNLAEDESDKNKKVI